MTNILTCFHINQKVFSNLRKRKKRLRESVIIAIWALQNIVRLNINNKSQSPYFRIILIIKLLILFNS